MEETLKALDVAGHHILIARHGLGVGKENTEHAANVVNDQWNSRFFCRFQQTFCQTCCQLIQRLVNARLRDFIQTGETGCHRNRVTGKRTRLVDRTGWGQRIHHITTTTECAYWHSTADDFAQAGEVWHHVVIILRASQRYAETGHHFIDDQQRAKFVTQRTQTRHELWQRRNTVHIACHRLDDNTGNLLRVLLKCGAYRSQIIISTG